MELNGRNNGNPATKLGIVGPRQKPITRKNTPGVPMFNFSAPVKGANIRGHGVALSTANRRQYVVPHAQTGTRNNGVHKPPYPPRLGGSRRKSRRIIDRGK